ncbi:MAG TPA: type II TA system antitoxin MqsA family protein, partial [Terriglobia bacterium]|nr:type II TA system antitoxin MqsA family protein [Terriglobia bacterium]
MNCVECGRANLEPAMVRLTGNVRGQEYTVGMEGLKCPLCGYETIEGPQMAEFGRLLADRYRADHGLLTSVEIRSLRKRLGMTQDEFARHVGVGVASVKRWEMGKIQDQRSNECIIRKTELEPKKTPVWTNDMSALVSSAYSFPWRQIQGAGVFAHDYPHGMVVGEGSTNIVLAQTGMGAGYGILVGTPSPDS